MNILDNEIYNAIQENIPYIMDAYAKVYGEEHRELIEERINRIIYVIYNDIDGINDYIDFLENCKQKQLAIKFLEKIGVNTKNQIENYAEKLDKDIDKIVYKYLGFYWGLTTDTKQGIKAWRTTDENEYVKLEKIRFINFLRGENEPQITIETFQEFCKTDEYKEIIEEIKEYLKVYEGIVQEYEEYLKELEPYKEYVEEENKRRNDIQTQKRNMIYMQIEDKLTEDIKDYLNKNYSSIDEKSRCFLGEELGEKSYLEYFSKEDENKLDDISINENDKNRIYYFRKRYFQSIGIKIDDFSLDDMEKYEYYIERGYKKLVPTQELIEEITKLKEKAYSECKKEFICNSKDFIRNTKIFANTEENIEGIYSRVKDSIICITSGNSNKGFISILFFTIRDNCSGLLDYILLHEIGHDIEAEDMLEKNDYRSGFEFGTVNVPKNPYNENKRKYERLNETIRDMLSIEAREILHEQGIYIFEQKELIRDAKNFNTHSICKDLLKPFLNNYRENIVDALLYGNMKDLYNRIGEENFEELNDIVNRVDYFIQKFGLVQKLENSQNESTIVVEYYKQLERLSKVYDNMERHQLKEQSSNDLLKSAIDATEKTTRLGNIEDAISSISNTFEQEFEEGKNKQENERNQ